MQPCRCARRRTPCLGARDLVPPAAQVGAPELGETEGGGRGGLEVSHSRTAELGRELEVPPRPPPPPGSPASPEAPAPISTRGPQATAAEATPSEAWELPSPRSSGREEATRHPRNSPCAPQPAPTGARRTLPQRRFSALPVGLLGVFTWVSAPAGGQLSRDVLMFSRHPDILMVRAQPSRGPARQVTESRLAERAQ